MALAERAELTARLSLDDRFSGPLKRVQGSVGRLEKTLGSARFKAAGAQIGTGLRNSAILAAGGVALLATQVGAGLASLAELERLGAQTSAVIKSTGGAAGVTADQVRNLSEKMESLNATIDDKVIQNAQNLLLTFTAIRKDAFEPTLAAVLDMNAAMGGGEEGLQGAAIMVGKAMQDPIRGLTALRRVGVNFTKDQEKQIRALVETGDVMGAQKLILAELNREFGGSFLAQGDTTAGKVAKFKDAIEDLQKSLAAALLPAIGKVSARLSEFLANPSTIKAIGDLGAKIGGLFSDANIDKGVGLLSGAFETIRGVLPALKDAAAVSGQVLSTAVGLFRSLPPDLQKLAIGALAVNKLTGGLVTNLVGGIAGLALSSLRTITAANVTVIGANVTGGGLPGGAGGGIPGQGGGFNPSMLIPFVGGLIASIGIGQAIDNAIGIPTSIEGTLARVTVPSDTPTQRAIATDSHNTYLALLRQPQMIADALARHAALGATIGTSGGAFLRTGASAKTLDENAGKLVELFRTSTNPSLKSMTDNLAVIKGLAGKGDPATRQKLSDDIKALEAMIAAKLDTLATTAWDPSRGEPNRDVPVNVTVNVTSSITANAVTRTQQQIFRINKGAKIGVW